MCNWPLKVDGLLMGHINHICEIYAPFFRSVSTLNHKYCRLSLN